jgi:hypothetical protein
MVLQWGMADELGPEYFGSSGDDALNGRGFNPWEPTAHDRRQASKVAVD